MSIAVTRSTLIHCVFFLLVLPLSLSLSLSPLFAVLVSSDLVSVKICDLGMVKLKAYGDCSSRLESNGTPLWMAPEVLLDQAYDESDTDTQRGMHPLGCDEIARMNEPALSFLQRRSRHALFTLSLSLSFSSGWQMFIPTVAFCSRFSRGASLSEGATCRKPSSLKGWGGTGRDRSCHRGYKINSKNCSSNAGNTIRKPDPP